MAKILIQITNVFKNFDLGGTKIEVLKDINVNFNERDFMIIFGPSGCGKSTLLHTMLGLEAPTSGKVLVENKDFYQTEEDERAFYRRYNIGIIYQQPLWISALNVYKNLLFPLKLQGFTDEQAKERIQQALKTVGMLDYIDHRPSELSSGQQQKISLARTLTIQPKIIIADEPTGNLDSVSGRELIKTFLDLNQKGMSIIMVTHDLGYLKYASHLVHIIDGKVVEEGNINKGAQANSKDLPDVYDDVRDPIFLKKIRQKNGN